jgi:hypothetical protein
LQETTSKPKNEEERQKGAESKGKKYEVNDVVDYLRVNADFLHARFTLSWNVLALPPMPSR